MIGVQQLNKYILTDISYIEGSVKDIDNVKLANFCFTEGVRYDEDSTGSRYEDFKIPSCDEWDKILENIQYQYFKVYKTALHLSEHWAHIHKKYESTNLIRREATEKMGGFFLGLRKDPPLKNRV